MGFQPPTWKLKQIKDKVINKQYKDHSKYKQLKVREESGKAPITGILKNPFKKQKAGSGRYLSGGLLDTD